MNDRLLKRMILETIQETLGESEKPDVSPEIEKAYQSLIKVHKMLKASGGSKSDLKKIALLIKRIDELGLDAETDVDYTGSEDMFDPGYSYGDD
jgi:hypothetical protein